MFNRIKRGILLTMVILGWLTTTLHAQEAASKSDAQALFIYNFTKMIEWPANLKTGEFVIGVVGSSETVRSLTTATKSKKVGAQSIVVKAFKEANEVNGCHIVMIAANKMDALVALSARAKSEHMLLISERTGAIEKGAAINFMMTDGKLKYEIAAASLGAAGLKHATMLENLAAKKY